MNLPKPNKINAEKYVAGLSSFKKRTIKIKLSANESALDRVLGQEKNLLRLVKI